MRIIAKLRTLITLSHDEKGAAMAEYGLIATAIAMVVAAAVWALGDKVLALYEFSPPF